MAYTTEEIREKYERFARWYDLADLAFELLGVARGRREVVQRARGRVLELAVGTGKNLPYYPRDCEITAVDVSPAMLEIARRRARRLGRALTCLVMDAETLTFPDHRFDTVVSTMSLCTFPHPVTALREMGRVCRSDGRILLMEHGRSDREWLGKWLDRTAEKHARQLGCHWNRRPLDLVREAGLSVVSARQIFLGVFNVIEAAPP